ncbi:Piwi domain-containing protein [Collybia nuda]|uniref:Piwi domain-containing protein n=1 Tax=Collybia nuda TaxID=64659 RepID=A0A9P6CER7_9AGAR|nr:Piwi domain-containing protein [Collybia nuda]
MNHPGLFLAIALPLNLALLLLILLPYVLGAEAAFTNASFPITPFSFASMSSRRMGFYALINDVPGISEKRQTGECEIPGGLRLLVARQVISVAQLGVVQSAPFVLELKSAAPPVMLSACVANPLLGLLPSYSRYSTQGDECCSSEACCNGNCCASGSICERGECINEELKDKIIRFDIMDNNLNVSEEKTPIPSHSAVAIKRKEPKLGEMQVYPPASSLEGGKSTDAIERAINCVPKRENDHQGGKFGGLQSKLRSREIPFERGDKFVISIDCNKVLGDLAPRSKDMKGMMYEGLVDIGERNLEEKKLSVALKVRDGGEITMSGNETVDPGLVGLLDGNQKHSYLAAPFGDLDPGNYSMKIQIMNGSTFGGFVLDNEGFNFSTNDTGIGAGQSQEYTFSLEDWTPGMGLFLGTTNNRTRIRWNLDGTLGQPAPNATTNSSSFPTPTGTGGGQQESPNSAAQGTFGTKFILGHMMRVKHAQLPPPFVLKLFKKATSYNAIGSRISVGEFCAVNDSLPRVNRKKFIKVQPRILDFWAAVLRFWDFVDNRYYPFEITHNTMVMFLPNENIDKAPRKRQEIIHKLQTVVAPDIFSPRAVYDGKALLYAPQALQLPSSGGGTFLVSLTSQAPVIGTRGTFQVKISQTIGDVIKPESDINRLIMTRQTSTQAAIATNLLQLLIRQQSNQQHPNNNKAYFTPVGKREIAYGLELWRGYFQSVRPTIGKMLVNIDTATSAVYSSEDFVASCMQVTGSRDVRELATLDGRNMKFHILKKFLLNVRITVRTIGGGKRPKVIRDLVPFAGNYEFPKDDQTITINEYYKQAYGIKLKFPNLPGIQISGKNAPFPIIIPAELCAIIPGQLYKKAIPDHLTKSMVDFATIRPDDRLRQIQHGGGIQSPLTDYQNSEFIVESGMVVNASPISISGRILDPPKMKYGENEVRPRDGAWNVVNQKLHTPKALTCWAVVNFCPTKIPSQGCQDMMQNLMKCCGILGTSTSQPGVIEVGSGHAVEKALTNALQKSRETLGSRFSGQSFLLIVILPLKAAEIRLRVKHWGDIIQGVQTQCLREDKVTGARDQYWNNVALKLNARLGGYNALTDTSIMRQLSQEPYMIMGADVGHPAPGVKRPSITSLVWSHDRFATQYAAFTKLQHPRLEMIGALKEMVKDAIVAFGSKNKASPRRIIFFRDGVSEGEFEQIAEGEIGAVKGAFDEIWAERGLKEPKPTLTFIIVGKRHHVVFFPQDANARDKTGNCRAGFVADQGICHPVIPDFYLQSHAAVKGTSRSGHYSVLADENYHYNLDKLQEIAFALCHVYAKATRSISIPAPVYYADLVCSRGDFHFGPDSNLTFTDNATSTSDSKDFDLERWVNGWLPANKNSNKTMYFL